MYVMRSTKSAAFNDWLETLTEMTTKELRDAQALASDNTRYRQVTGQEAHRYIKQGGHHETPLYVDMDNRVRYASDGYC